MVIADDHPPQRLGVRSALEAGGFEVVAEAGDAAGAYEAALEYRPDVCLLDIHMPGNGIRAAARITESLPDTAVVMLTVSRNDQDLFDALRVGASGYLLKDIDPEELPDALKGVIRGEAAIPASLVTRLMEEFRAPSRKRKLPLVGRRDVELTSKEWEVLDLMRGGASTAEMAERLFVTPVTVRTHVSQILKKLKVKSRDEALRLLEADDA
ncbi:MAG TPA: response regulator transcription factor [Actinomycetota bacterium]|nr:response regulator transcription factor [Actinomycetota bacterium]